MLVVMVLLPVNAVVGIVVGFGAVERLILVIVALSFNVKQRLTG